MKHKLLIVTDYSETHTENFVAHMEEFFKGKDIEFKILIVDLKSNKKVINYGKLFNIGFVYGREALIKSLSTNYDFDYIVFHRTDFIPLNEYCNYEFDDRPKCLVNSIDEISFGVHPDFRPDGENLPNDYFYNGALMFSKEVFENVGGFSNNFWGDGYEDLHMLYKLNKLGYPMDKKIKKERVMNGIKIDYGNYGVINPVTKDMKRLFNGNFTCNVWVKLDEEIEKESYVFSRSGYHSGIKFTKKQRGDKQTFISCNLWNAKDEYIRVGDYPVQTDVWYFVSMNYSIETKTSNMYVNGSLVGSTFIEKPLKKYQYNTPIFVGCATNSTQTSRCFSDISIGELSFFDITLNENSLYKLYKNNIMSKEDYVVERPIGYYNYNSGYKSIIWDESGHGNNMILTNFVIPKINVVKEKSELYLPLRDRGNFGYIGNEFEKLDKTNYTGKTANKNIVLLQNLTNKKITNDLTECRYRVLKAEPFWDRHCKLLVQG